MLELEKLSIAAIQHSLGAVNSSQFIARNYYRDRVALPTIVATAAADDCNFEIRQTPAKQLDLQTQPYQSVGAQCVVGPADLVPEFSCLPGSNLGAANSGLRRTNNNHNDQSAVCHEETRASADGVAPRPAAAAEVKLHEWRLENWKIKFTVLLPTNLTTTIHLVRWCQELQLNSCRLSFAGWLDHPCGSATDKARSESEKQTTQRAGGRNRRPSR